MSLSNPLFKINGAGVGVSGKGLWKLGVWGSSSPAGEGERVSYQEQVMKFHTLTLNCIRGGSMVPNIWFFGSRILTPQYFGLIIIVIA